MAIVPIADRHKMDFHRRAPIKEAVRVATTANITIASDLNVGDTIDGVTLADGDRVLVKNQSTGSQNGIYTAGATPALAYDEISDDPSFGYLVFVIAGTTNGNTLWMNTNTTAPTIGTTALTFSQIAPSSTYTLTIKDEGTPLATGATSLDFVGAGVTATGTTGAKTITIPGGASTLDDLTDVTITSPATADRLRYDGAGQWRNSALIWTPLTVYNGTDWLPLVDGDGNAIMAEA